MDSSEYINDLIESGTNVIFSFGYTGCGKTCFFMTIVKYLLENCVLELNSKDNMDGIYYIETLLKNLEDGKLPPPSSLGEVEDVDLKFKIDGKETILTFLDMAGEDLKLVDPTESAPDSTLELRKRGTLIEKINRYLQSPDLSVILLCFIDHDAPEKQNRLIHKFFNYINSYYDFNFNRVALIVSKWDKSKNKYDLSEFLNKNCRQSYLWLKDKVDKPNAFVFSMGTVIENSAGKRLKGKKLNLEYCKDIVDWLREVGSSAPTRLKEPSIKEIITTLLERSIKFIWRVTSFVR